MSDDNQKLIEQFSAISGVDTERSRFYLESAAWNIEAALSSLYEEDDGDAADIQHNRSANDKPVSMPNLDMIDSDSSEEGQAFYAGGSEHSGQQVLGPSKKKKDVVSMLFKSAKKHGAEVLEGKGVSPSNSTRFSGVGYTLGETEDDHQAVSQPMSKEEKPKDVTLKMWKTGFSVGDGPLRSYEDPANQEFLNSVKRGQVPLELVRSAKGGEVYINMEDHRNEDYVPQQPKLVAFSGSGHSLGSPAPQFAGQSLSSPSLRTASPSQESLEEEAKTKLNTDDARPVTNVQLRLPNGSRTVLRLNHSHTVGDIRCFLRSTRPSLHPSFVLMTTFPHAELNDDQQTLTQAKLLNAVLVVK